jgi:hypothetical protein
MFVEMKQTFGTPAGALICDRIYDVEPELGHSLIRSKLAAPTDKPPTHIAKLLDILDDGAGKACLFLPPAGLEFGHICLSFMRIVHFHKAAFKVVCCRPGHEVLFPSADVCITDWIDPVPDKERIGTQREKRFEWPDLTSRFPGLHHVRATGLTPEQEIFAIQPAERIPFNPQRRGLQADLVFGVRRRDFCAERNWPHWQKLADAATAAGLTFAVIGDRATSFSLDGEKVHSGDYDTDAAVELLQNCRLYVGTDTGASHLAATVGARMLVFRETRCGSRDLTPRMEEVNPGRVVMVHGGWTKPDAVAKWMLSTIGMVTT